MTPPSRCRGSGAVDTGTSPRVPTAIRSSGQIRGIVGMNRMAGSLHRWYDVDPRSRGRSAPGRKSRVPWLPVSLQVGAFAICAARSAAAVGEVRDRNEFGPLRHGERLQREVWKGHRVECVAGRHGGTSNGSPVRPALAVASRSRTPPCRTRPARRRMAGRPLRRRRAQRAPRRPVRHGRSREHRREARTGGPSRRGSNWCTRCSCARRSRRHRDRRWSNDRAGRPGRPASPPRP